MSERIRNEMSDDFLKEEWARAGCAFAWGSQIFKQFCEKMPVKPISKVRSTINNWSFLRRAKSSMFAVVNVGRCQHEAKQQETKLGLTRQF